MMDRARPRWYEIIPGWVPICFSILAAAIYAGQWTQSINDRLTNLEKEVQAIQEYIRTDHKGSNELPPISAVQSQQDAISTPRVQ